MQSITMPHVMDVSQVTVSHAVLFHIHLLLAGAIILGAVLFKHWAVTSLLPAQLRALSLWILAGATVLMLATVPFCLGIAMFL